MHIEILHKPAHTLAVISLDQGESFRAESGAMVAKSTALEVETNGPFDKKKGGILGGLKRSMLGGETLFTNTFTASRDGQKLQLAPALCGDMAVHDITDGGLLIQSSSYIASPDNVQLDTRFEGLKGLFSGERLFFLHATGTGPVIINAFGAIEAVQLDGELIVDTGHIVAFTEGISYTVEKASTGWIDSFLSGEGFVLRLSGRGVLYLQTRNPMEYGKAVGSKLPARQ
jgi:uncharacterized protein (TIGR00266 family)